MQEFFKEKVVYQIYPRSFNDTNGDGVGDIRGIIQKLDYLKDLGIGIIWLSPVYTSPNEDNGYDISDYLSINPEYGTMADMDELISEAKSRDIKIIMDLVINHTSSQHDWFEKSRQGIEPYADYYIWRKGEGDKLPNNWTGFFGGSVWEYDDMRKEYYLHLFTKGQPDLNYSNPKVLDEIKSIMHFWLKKGIAGFRCDAINVIYKSSLKDGKKRLFLTGCENYLSQDGMHQILNTLKEDVLDRYGAFTVGETAMVDEQMGRDLCDKKRKELDMIFTFEHMDADQFIVKWFPKKFNARKFNKIISKWQNELEWCANYFENHDQPRSVSRFGDDKTYKNESAKMLATLLLTLRGTPFIYQGQEIGMTNFDFTSLDEIEDVETHNIMEIAKKLHIPKFYRWKMILKGSRDHARTPMQWSSDKNGGFTDGTPWLGVNKNHKMINAKNETANKDSIYNYYKKLISLRSQSDILKYGDFIAQKISKKLFKYKRELNGQSIEIILNFSGKKVRAKYQGEILLSNYDKQTEGVLRPYEAIILKGGEK